ncbi:MAG: hypothetical protein MK226_05745 [Saprospiraceae bacterium]|jgi:ABC-type transport system involved in multi-copper enzyme maturation permease subunit|nr:hypothetical protein [Saprospiraceae bacterium]
MLLLSFTDWWSALSIESRLLGSAVIITTMLLIIFEILNQLETPNKKENKLSTKYYLSPYHILYFFTAFSWATLIAHHLFQHPTLIIGIGLGIGVMVTAVMIWLLPSLKTNRKQQLDQNTNILQSVGEVAQVIPPHRNGFGKIHLNFRTGPYELEAITAGDELPMGSSIKVVDIINERIVLVERVTNSQRNVEGLDDRPPGSIGPQQ